MISLHAGMSSFASSLGDIGRQSGSAVPPSLVVSFEQQLGSARNELRLAQQQVRARESCCVANIIRQDVRFETRSIFMVKKTPTAQIKTLLPLILPGSHHADGLASVTARSCCIIQAIGCEKAAALDAGICAKVTGLDQHVGGKQRFPLC